MKRCDRCRFFHAHPPARSADEMVFAHDGVYGGGQCRRHPPARDELAQIATFPDVPSGFWCGEFEPGDVALKEGAVPCRRACQPDARGSRTGGG